MRKQKVGFLSLLVILALIVAPVHADAGMVRAPKSPLLTLGDVVTSEDVLTLTVDYSRSLADMVEDGKYEGGVNGNIIARNFPHDPKKGTVEVQARLFVFDREISSEEVIVAMKKDGYQPADLPTLLSFGAHFPDRQVEFPIFALGSIANDPKGNPYAAYLYRWDKGRMLNLFSFDFTWTPHVRFLAVRVPRSSS